MATSEKLVNWFSRPVDVALLGLLTAITAGYVLREYEPGPGGFYPSCPVHSFTGWHCSGCGCARCLHALLNGDLAQAAAYNVLVLTLTPFMLFAGAWGMVEAALGRRLRGVRWPSWFIPALAVLIVVFGVVRNLPIAPFSWLAPHKLDSRE